jgi:putative DNA primase/helicase
LIESRKKENESDRKNLQGEAIWFEEPEPWDDPVDGEDMLSSIEDQIRRFIMMPEHSYTAVSLWCTLTYLIDTAAVMPMLCFNSPTRECGKTRGLEIVNRLARRPTMASSISPGAIVSIHRKGTPYTNSR